MRLLLIHDKALNLAKEMLDARSEVQVHSIHKLNNIEMTRRTIVNTRQFFVI